MNQEAKGIPPIVDPAHPVDYSKLVAPPNYQCHSCGATGCKLWREYQTFLDQQSLLCAKCAAENQKESIDGIDAEGRRISDCGRTDQIGWYIPAVPTEENDTYWGYTSVPEAGVRWWRSLPTLPEYKGNSSSEKTI